MQRLEPPINTLLIVSETGRMKRNINKIRVLYTVRLEEKA